MSRGLRFFFRFFAITVVLRICLFSAASAQTTYTVTDLGVLGETIINEDRFNFSAGFGINASGEVTGTSSTADNEQHAFLYIGGTMTDLGKLPLATSSAGLGVNDSGQVTGFSTPGGVLIRAFLYSGGTMTDLGSLGGEFADTEGFAINNSGRITGFSNTVTPGIHAFLYSGGTMTDLGTLGGSTSFGAAINDSGQITGRSSTTGDTASHAFLYSGGTMTDLGTLGGKFSFGNGINISGQVTGGSATTGDTASHAFLYSGGTMMDLGTLGGTFGQGLGINASGLVVGSSRVTGDTTEHAFFYSANTGMVDLNTLLPSDSGWTLTQATAINDSGQITGFGTNPSGLTHAFLLTPATIPFSTFDAKMGLTGKPPTKFRLKGSFTLGAGSTGIDPVNQPVTLKLGTFSVSIPTGSFTTTAKGDYDFQGTVGGVAILFRITSVTSTSFTWEAKGATNTGLPATNPVSVALTIGNNTGTVSVTAHGQGK